MLTFSDFVLDMFRTQRCAGKTLAIAAVWTTKTISLVPCISHSTSGVRTALGLSNKAE
jgi:hypothetical protein